MNVKVKVAKSDTKVRRNAKIKINLFYTQKSCLMLFNLIQ